MDILILSIVIIVLIVMAFYISLFGIKEGILLNKTFSISAIMIFTFWNPFLLKNLMQYPPEIFRHHILISFSIYIGTLLFYEILPRGKDTYHILGFNYKRNSQKIVEEALEDLAISYNTGDSHTVIQDGNKIIYHKKDICFINISDTNIKKKLKERIEKKLSYTINTFPVIYALLSLAIVLFMLVEAIRMLFNITNF